MQAMYMLILMTAPGSINQPGDMNFSFPVCYRGNQHIYLQLDLMKSNQILSVKIEH